MLLGAALSAAALTLVGCGAASSTTSSAATKPSSPTSAAAVTPASKASDSLQALQQQYVKVVDRVNPSVVLVRTDAGLGSGIVMDSQGDIVTNNHVVEKSHDFQVALANGKQYAATLVGTFPPDDLAVLHIDASGLHPAAFANSSKLSVGDLALAVGNPLGLQSSVTEGIVSALGRTVNEDNGVAIPDVIQTSAAINPGNSGGALVDIHGEVIGIPTLTATDPQLGGGQAPGIGFAIPSNTVHDIASQLVQDGKVTDSHRAYLGVGTANTTSGGPLVVQVTAGGPAATAGVRAGDLITSLDGSPTPDPAALADVLAGLRPGQSVALTVVHPGGVKQTLEVTLGQYPG
jgi:S1-C subfamily serine protease